MKNIGGPLFLIGTAIFVASSGMISPGGGRNRNPPPDDPIINDAMPNGNGGNNNGNSNNGSGGNGTNSTNPDSSLPPNPTDGSVPDGYQTTQSGVARVDFDGTGQYPTGDTHSLSTSYQINGQSLNGDTTGFVVQNMNANGGYTYPVGTKVYVVNNDTGQGSWSFIGDNGPTNSGRNEMSPAQAAAVGVTIDRNSDGSYKNSNSDSNITYYYYPNS